MEVSSIIFSKVFGKTRPGTEPRSPGSLANTSVLKKKEKGKLRR